MHKKHIYYEVEAEYSNINVAEYNQINSIYCRYKKHIYLHYGVEAEYSNINVAEYNQINSIYCRCTRSYIME